MPEIEWGWLIVGGFASGGVGGSSYLVPFLASLKGGEKYDPLAKFGTFVFLALTMVAIFLLILDLGRPLGLPANLLHLTEVFNNLGSTMSWGAYFLTASLVLALLVSSMWLSQWQRGALRNVVWTIGAVAALSVVFYPGFTLAFSDGTVFWRSPFLPWLIFTNALTGGLYFVALVQTGIGRLFPYFIARPEEEVLGTLLSWGKWLIVAMAAFLAGHLVYALILETRYLGSAFAVNALLAGGVSLWFWILAVAIGLLLPLFLSFYAGWLRGTALRNAALAACLTRLVGVVFLLYSLIIAGQLAPTFPIP